MLSTIFEVCATFLLVSFMVSVTVVFFIGMLLFVRMTLQDMQRYFHNSK